MIDLEWEMLETNPEWRLVLEAYRRQHEELLAANPESEGWLPRIHAVEGVSEEQIAPIHGKLIAAGFLKFELTVRTSGVVYQLSGQARQALLRANVDADESDGGEVESAA